MNKIPKATLYHIVEVAYRDGVGARRLGRMVGFSATYIRQAARDLGCPVLARRTGRNPSLQLINLIASVQHHLLASAGKV